MTRKSIWSYIIAAGITLSQPIATSAKYPIANLTDLAVRADVIVIAKVEKVSADARGVRRAEARVLAVWKGKPNPVVTFRASALPSNMCDGSDAHEGETVALFLVKEPRTNVMSISHRGQGRIPIEDEGGKTMALLNIQEDCDKATTGPEQQSSIGTIEVGELDKRVRKILRAKRAPCEF